MVSAGSAGPVMIGGEPTTSIPTSFLPSKANAVTALANSARNRCAYDSWELRMHSRTAPGYIREHGKVVLDNSSLHTRTMLKLKVPAFTEVACYNFLVATHLACPLGVGHS